MILWSLHLQCCFRMHYIPRATIPHGFKAEQWLFFFGRLTSSVSVRLAQEKRNSRGMSALWSEAQNMSALTAILWACKILYLIIKEQVLLWYLEVYLCCHDHIRILWYFLIFNYRVQFLKLQGPLSFFDYAVFCEIEILIETRVVLLFLEKKSNLWSPSYMQDLIKSLMEVTKRASAETQLFFIHEKHELSLRSQTEISIMHGGFLCLPM